MSTGSSWSDREIILAVEDYFAMLLAEVEGREYSKSEHRRALVQKLDGRSNSSVERKHQNISAVLIGLNIAPIDGYKPLSNYQRRLAADAARYIDQHPELIDRLLRVSEEMPSNLKVVDGPLGHVQVDPPEMIKESGPGRDLPSALCAMKVDFADRDQRNRKLGELGERFVLSFEKHRLLGVGRDDLAKKIDWVAQSRGDGLGYDIVSFDDRSDRERFIEVKTTNMGLRAPFYITSNELKASDQHKDDYLLYRVFRFSKDPKLFVLNPPLGSRCDLEPRVYRACF
jgi:hypothetical protein